MADLLITAAQLRAITPLAGARADAFATPLAAAMLQFEVNTPTRAAAFLAQVAHESGQLRLLREIWGPTPTQRRYEGKADLGNVEPGDGKRFMGRGLIQVTGRKNGIHDMPFPLWIAQKYAREGYQFTPTEVIHHADS